MALTISTGFVVDDAIVMIENIARYIEEGEAPFEAALKGAKQIGFTIVSLTVSLVAVLIPLLFMGGHHRPALPRVRGHARASPSCVSAVLSLTLTADDVRAPPAARAEGRGARAPLPLRRSAASTAMLALLRPRARRGCSRHQRTTLLVTIATVVAHRAARVRGAQGLLPAAGHRAHHRRLRGARRRLVHAHDGAAARRSPTSCARDPDVASVASFIGADGTNADHQQRAPLHHARSRATSGAPTPTRSSPACSPSSPQVAGHHALPAAGAGPADRQPRQPHASTSTRSRTPTPQSSREWAPQRPRGAARAARAAATWPAISRPRARHARSTIDRDTASRLGVSPQAIDDTLYDAFGQRQVSTIFTQLNLYRVILEVKPEFQQDPDALDAALRALARRATQVPLSRVRARRAGAGAARRQPPGPVPAVTLSFNLAPGRVARRRGRRRSARRGASIGLPPGAARRLPGHGAGLPRVAGERAAARSWPR